MNAQRLTRLTLLAGLILLGGCGELVDGLGGGGGGESSPGSGSVSGRFGAQDFNFTPTDVSGTWQPTGTGQGDLSIFLCEGSCNGGGRRVSLFVHGNESDVRNGASFPIGRGANGVVDGNAGTSEAASGEVAIESAALRDGGHGVGTFQLTLRSGDAVKGFFDAPLSGSFPQETTQNP